MIFEGFKLHAVPTIHEAHCRNKKCKKKPELVEVSNGMLSLSMALFCTECKSVYLLKLIRKQNVPKEFIQQCLDEVERDNRRREASYAFTNELEERKELERDKKLKKSKKFVK